MIIHMIVSLLNTLDPPSTLKVVAWKETLRGRFSSLHLKSFSSPPQDCSHFPLMIFLYNFLCKPHSLIIFVLRKDLVSWHVKVFPPFQRQKGDVLFRLPEALLDEEFHLTAAFDAGIRRGSLNLLYFGFEGRGGVKVWGDKPGRWQDRQLRIVGVDSHTFAVAALR